MTKAADTLMALAFPFLDVIPFTLPRYWIFRDKLRLPFRYTVLLQLVLAAAYSAVFYSVNLGGPAAAERWTTKIRYVFLLMFLALAFLLIKESFSKLMFTWLLFLAWQFFVLGNANFIESRYFPDFSSRHPYLVYNAARALIYLITFPALHHFFFHTVTEALKINDANIWRYFWKIPLFSTLFGMLYCTVADVYAFASWQFLVSRYLMLLGACYVSHITLKVLETSRSRTQLEESLKCAGRSLLAQKKQYDSLAVHLDEMRKVRHDLRQHLAAVQSYIKRDDTAGLSKYLDIYKDKLPPDTMKLYCRSGVVNAVICFYAAQARSSNIQFEAETDYPDGCPVSVTDITVLLGNLLENAVEACRREKESQKFIRLRIKRQGGRALLILTDNTCLTTVEFDGETPLSSKRKGAGIGVSSIREIAARYSGATQFEHTGGVFYASVFLKYSPPEGRLGR